MKVANTRESLVLALKNDKNSGRWEEFVNQYYDYLSYAACKVDKETGRRAFVPDGVDPCEAVEQTFWQLKNIILPDCPQFDVDFTEDQLAKKVRHGLKWLAAQYAIEAVMSDPRIERQTKAMYELLLEHAQNGRHGDGAFEAIAARFKVSLAAVYKHRQRMEERLNKYYRAFLDAREIYR